MLPSNMHIRVPLRLIPSPDMDFHWMFGPAWVKVYTHTIIYSEGKKQYCAFTLVSSSANLSLFFGGSPCFRDDDSPFGRCIRQYYVCKPVLCFTNILLSPEQTVFFIHSSY